MQNIKLSNLGFRAGFQKQSAQYPALYPARISGQYPDLYRVIAAHGELWAQLSGKLSYMNKDTGQYPVVGDWALIDRLDDSCGHATIHHILSRHSLLQRKAAGQANVNQPLAANIDTIFICMSLNNNYNLRRLERYLAVAWDSLATPVVVLTKSDLCSDTATKLSAVHSAAVGVDVLVTTTALATGQDELQQYLIPGNTIAFIGSSGVGKSTLINSLAGKAVLATNAVGKSDKGRHTTTGRQLIILDNGCVVIDTPGMRELQLETADLAKSFADINELSQNCRFSDCTHHSEPGCAVIEAINNRLLTADRLASYQKLQMELKYQELNSRQLEQEKINRMFGGKSQMKQLMNSVKTKNKHR